MRARRSTAAVVAASAVLATASLAQAAPRSAPAVRLAEKSAPATVNRALGNGLGRLVAQPRRTSSLRQQRPGFRIDQESLAIRDSAGRVLVDVTPRAGVDRRAFRRQVEGLGLVVKAVDATHGTVEGFVPLSAVGRIAGLDGVGTIAQSLKPRTDVGDATSRGVALHRAARVQRAGVDGRGVTIGALSDSYNAARLDPFGDPQRIHAKQDVASGDLPGAGNARYPQPVVVLADPPRNDVDTDEGRGMLQIAHDVAPGAKLCFATANGGMVTFAQNIRRLANKSGRCGADVVVDDITYFDEPMFSDSVLSDAIDDVTRRARSTSPRPATPASSRPGPHGPPGPRAAGRPGHEPRPLEVDPALYDGGLQDLDPGAGTDVAQSLALGEDGGLLDLQWDDPVDLDGAKLGDPNFSASGAITAAQPAPSFAFTPTAAQVGKIVQFRTDGIPSGTTDLILSVDAPDGTNLGTVDTGSSPEVLAAG